MIKQFNNEENLIWEQNASPLLLALTLPDLKSLKEWFNLGHFTTIVIFENENQAKWVFRKKECNLMGSKIVDILKNSTYKDNFREAIVMSSAKLLRRIESIENNKKLSCLSLEEAIKEFKKFTKCFYNYFKYSVLVEPIEWYTQYILSEHINNMSISLEKKKEMLQYLLKTEKDSFSTKIVIALNKCAIKLDKFLKENKDLLNYDSDALAKSILESNIKSLSYQELLISLNNFAKLYYWKNNNYYQTQKLNIKDILKELLENIYQKNRDFKTYENNILEIVENKEKALKKKRNFEKKLPQYLQDIVAINNEFGGQLGDERKEIVMKSLGALDKILEVISSKTNYSLEDIHMLIPQEIDDFASNYKNYKERFKRRRNGFLIYHTDIPLLDEITYQNRDDKNILNWKINLMDTPIIVEEQQVPEVLEKLNKYYNLFNDSLFSKNNLRGTTVYRDKNKRKIRGKVKIIKDPKKERISKNEILVATSTTPDFINAIHNAKAVITDWGGLTSHAAIITRELKKPCIVGTNYATTILKDGDEVEIDFEKEIIVILGKKGE